MQTTILLFASSVACFVRILILGIALSTGLKREKEDLKEEASNVPQYLQRSNTYQCTGGYGFQLRLVIAIILPEGTRLISGVTSGAASSLPSSSSTICLDGVAH